MDELVKLAERCEAADDNSDALLFMEAFEAIFGGRKSLGLQWSKFCAMLDAEACENAALILLPEGWEWNWHGPAQTAVVHPTGFQHKTAYRGYSAYPALALLAAICRAKAGA